MKDLYYNFFVPSGYKAILVPESISSVSLQPLTSEWETIVCPTIKQASDYVGVSRAKLYCDALKPNSPLVMLGGKPGRGIKTTILKASVERYKEMKLRREI